MASGGLTLPPGLRDGDGGMVQQSQEESTPSCGVGNFVFLRAVYAPFVVVKVFETRDDGGGGEWPNCSSGPRQTRKFGMMLQAAACTITGK